MAGNFEWMREKMPEKMKNQMKRGDQDLNPDLLGEKPVFYSLQHWDLWKMSLFDVFFDVCQLLLENQSKK